MSQSSSFKSRPDPVTLRAVGGGGLKSWETLRVEGSGKIITSPKYVIDVTGTDPLSLGELGGGLNRKY